MNLISKTKQLVREHILPLITSVRTPIAKIIYKGDKRYCPICKSHTSAFLRYGYPPRDQAKCPICGSLERHRLDWLFFGRRTDLFDGRPKRMLHVAPEEFMSSKLRKIDGLDYLSADLRSLRAMVKMDIADIQYPDASFSIIYCSHVLEHVPNDKKAIAELFRVLKPDGWAVLQVPITAEKTYEDSSITTPEDRLRVFGHLEHVRLCGPDYADRIREGGFAVESISVKDVATDQERATMRIQEERRIFFCKKPSIRK